MSKKQKLGAVQLDELDYLRLVQARGAVDAAMLHAQRVVAEADSAVKAAQAAFVVALHAAAKQYKFDPGVSRQFDDEHFRLIPE